MAPSHKRKPVEDDFIHTVSDNGDEPIEQETEAPGPPKKKSKTSKKSKKRDQGTVPDEGELEGFWGQNDEDDGAMNSDFEFAADSVGVLDEAFEGWAFDGAKKAAHEDRKGVDLDQIIRRRRDYKASGNAPHDAAAGEERVDSDMIFALDDDEEGVLADDAFGMNVESEEEVDKADAPSGKISEDVPEESSSEDSQAEDSEVGTSDDSDQEDAEEAAKREAFFAPEEKPVSGKTADTSTFQAMSLSRPILRGLANVGFTKPTPIQAKTIPIALMGRDLVGGAVTGSGKTAAFVVPILERLLFRPKKIPTTRVVILAPTRELAIQCHAVATKLAAFTDIKFSLAVGGLSLKVQEAELKLRPDVIIATPGRFIDHMRNSASVSVDTVEIMVLDEADRMLEDGFADELNEIFSTLPKSRQTMLFSATMTSTVDRLIRVGLNKPVRLMVDSQKKTVGTLVQEFVRLRPGREGMRMGYLLHLCKTLYSDRVVVFFRQKKEAHRARIAFGLLGLSCTELHGSMNQTQVRKPISSENRDDLLMGHTKRIASVESFRDGKVSFLLATDLASRGLDIKGIDVVINYEAPQTPEIYVHRVGRTARAGRRGTALTLAAEPERKVVKSVVKAGKAQGAKIISRAVDPAEADRWQAEFDGLAQEIEEIIQEEKEERQLAQAEMQVRKGENIMEHEAAIKSRPKRTWFETELDKKMAKRAGQDELNGVRESMKKKGAGKLSNKDKKRLDAKAMRAEGKEWKKGKTSEASGKGKSAGPKGRQGAKKGKGRAKGKR